MFDGNHRTRRDVNLGGGNRSRNRRNQQGSRRSRFGSGGGVVGGLGFGSASKAGIVASSSATNKSSLLEETRILREERRQAQLRERSAKLIQRLYRGYKCRSFVLSHVEQRWDANAGAQQKQRGQNQQEDNYIFALNDLLEEQILLLSMRLCLPHYTKVPKSKSDNKEKKIDQALLEHGQALQEMLALAKKSNNQATQAPSFSSCSSARIVQATLRRFKPPKSAPTVETAHQIQIYKLILEYYLLQEQPQQQAKSLSPSQISFIQRLGGNSGCLQLIQCTQQWLWSNGSDTVAVANTLLEWTYQVLPELPDNNAIMGAILFGKQGLFVEDNRNDDCKIKLLQVDNQNIIQQCFVALVEAITNPNRNAQDYTSNGNVVKQNILKTINDREIIVLENALTLMTTKSGSSSSASQPPYASTLTLLHHVLTNHTDLTLLTSLVAHGEDITTIIDCSESMKIIQNHDDEEDDDISENDEDEQMMEADAATSSPPQENTQGTPQSQNTASAKSSYSKSTYPRRRNRLLTKQDIQTIPKLDRMYQDQLQRWKKETLTTLQNRDIKYQKKLVQMAQQIGNAQTWLEWAENNKHTGTDDDVDPFVLFLAVILQSITGVKPSTSAKSPFLSQLAFGRGSKFVEKLWETITKQCAKSSSSFSEKTCMYMIVFCDVFVQSLIATTDDKFLEKYTKIQSNVTNAAIDSSRASSVDPVFMVETVIAQLRILLHELYWTKPVTVLDIQMAATVGLSTTASSKHPSSSATIKATGDRSANTSIADDPHIRALRGRLLLSGTKCWNSLYERWCRLVRHAPFTDESTWWFPHLASREGDSAVVDMPENENETGEFEGALRMPMGGGMPMSTSRRRPRHQHQAQPMDEDMGHDDSVASMEIDSEDEDDQTNEDGQSNANINPADAESEALANSFRDPKMARVLTCIPQALPFDRRVRLFHSLLSADKLKTQDEASDFRMAMLMMMRADNDGTDPANALQQAANAGRERVEIRRDKLYEDSMNQLNQLGPRLKKKVQVTFINQHGSQEAGIDGGGVFKEFVDDLIRDAFSIDPTSHDSPTSSTQGDSSPPLFSVTPLQTLTINTSLLASANITGSQPQLLSHFEFLGRVLGKAVYESILVEPQFCLPFLNQLLGKRNSLEDLKNYDMEYYKNLIKLLSLKNDEIDNLGLTFEITLNTVSNKKRAVELIPGGKNIAVTKHNVIQYIHLVANQRLNKEGSIETRSFLKGFRDLVPASWVRLFSANELQKLISGDDSIRGIDIKSLQNTIHYAAGYHPSQPIIVWFWEIINEFTPDQQRKFLKFMTSCSRQPLLGFNSLDPIPCIQQIRLSDDLFQQDSQTIYNNVPLPTSSTCMNLLKLPNYRNKELMRKKLLDAIEAGAGFELT